MYLPFLSSKTTPYLEIELIWHRSGRRKANDRLCRFSKLYLIYLFEFVKTTINFLKYLSYLKPDTTIKDQLGNKCAFLMNIKNIFF